MTTSNHEKMLKQLRVRPVKAKKFIKHNKPLERKFGSASRRCIRCGKFGAHIQKYHLGQCRQCFREIAKTIGFKKNS